jgi:hypothetical protein
MNITLTSGFDTEVTACATALNECGRNIGDLDLGMVVVRHDSPEYHERAKNNGLIFHSFEQGGVKFHVALS